MGSMRSRIVFVVVIGIAVLVVVASQVLSGGGSSGGNKTSSATVVKGYIGSEKAGFLQSANIQQILADKYGIKVDYTTLGSIAQVTTTDTTGIDFLWPSNEVALVLYQETHAGTVKFETIFRSPIVLYSWAEVTDALIQQRIVTEENGIHYADMPKLVDLVLSDKTWADIGLTTISRKISIISTDPIESNSGNMFYGLLANLLSPNEVADDATIEQVLPTLKTYYNSLGFLSRGSGDLFSDFINTGMGAYPLIVNYESLLIEFTLQNPANRDEILNQLRIIYPRPTVWSNHPLIALTPNGEKLMEALKDPDVQRIAWEEHGFRSGLIGITNDTSVLQIVNIPATIDDVIPLPRPSVMSRIITALQAP
jgi:hypothetical protein